MTSRNNLIAILLCVLVLSGLATFRGELIALSIPFVGYFGYMIFHMPDRFRFVVSSSTDRETAIAGDVVTITTEIYNRGSDLKLIQLAQSISPGMELISGKNSLLTPMQPNEKRIIEFKVRVTRGEYHFQDIYITPTDKLGFYSAKQIQKRVPIELTVFPKKEKLSSIPIRPEKTHGYAGLIPSKQGGMGTNIFGIREFRPGDSQRHVHWKKTARHDEALFTKEFEQERVTDVGLILDARVSNDLLFPMDSLFEYNVKATGSLAESFLNDGHRVSLLIRGETQRMIFPGYGRKQKKRIMKALCSAKSGFNLALKNLRSLPTSYFPAKSQLVFITPLEKHDPEDLLKLQHQGYKILVISPDPISFERIHLPDSREVELAHRALTVKRDLLLRQLRAMNIQVVNWNVSRPLSQTIRFGISRSR